MNKIILKSFTEEFQKIAMSDDTKQTLINLGAGATAGAASGFAVAPLATIADIAGTNAKSPGDSFYGKSYKDISKMLYRSGKNKALLKKNLSTEHYSNILKDKEVLKTDPELTNVVSKLRSEGKITKDLGKVERVYKGFKEFYGGQGLKAFKMTPQNAINLALFAGLVGLGNKWTKESSD